MNWRQNKYFTITTPPEMYSYFEIFTRSDPICICSSLSTLLSIDLIVSYSFFCLFLRTRYFFTNYLYSKFSIACWTTTNGLTVPVKKNYICFINIPTTFKNFNTSDIVHFGTNSFNLCVLPIRSRLQFRVEVKYCLQFILPFRITRHNIHCWSNYYIGLNLAALDDHLGNKIPIRQ